MTKRPVASRYASFVPFATRARPSRTITGSGYSGGMTTLPARSIIPCLSSIVIGNRVGGAWASRPPTAAPMISVVSAHARRDLTSDCRWNGLRASLRPARRDHVLADHLDGAEHALVRN